MLTTVLEAVDAHVGVLISGDNATKHDMESVDRLLGIGKQVAVIGAELRKAEAAAAKDADLDPSRVLEWMRRRTREERAQLVSELEAMDRRTSVL
jgi:hypothetical protein